MKIIKIFMIIILLILVGTGMYYLGITRNSNLENKTNTTNNEELNLNNTQVSQNDKRIFLYNGIEAETIPGSVFVLQEAQNNIEKYKIKYYNYENGEYQGETSQGELQETYEGCYIVSNVSKIAISEKYNAIPRKSETINDIPLKLKERINKYEEYENEPKNNREIINLESIDLDGDGEKEYILIYKKQSDKGFSGIDLIKYDENADFYTITNLISISGEDNFGYEQNMKEWFTYSTDNIEYIDIDNDGIMEILIDVPNYEGLPGVSIYKYKNGHVYGDLKHQASTLP